MDEELEQFGLKHDDNDDSFLCLDNGTSPSSLTTTTGILLYKEEYSTEQ